MNLSTTHCCIIVHYWFSKRHTIILAQNVAFCMFFRFTGVCNQSADLSLY